MSDIVTINITEPVQQPVAVTVNEVLGRDGEGVPVGGTTGQVLTKVNNTDFNTTWSTPAGGGGVTYEDASDEFTGSADLTLTLAHNYKPGSIRLYKNDSRLKAVAFTEATANTITLNVARSADDEFIVDYKYLA